MTSLFRMFNTWQVSRQILLRVCSYFISRFYTQQPGWKNLYLLSYMWITKIHQDQSKIRYIRVLLPWPKEVSSLTNTDTLISYKYKMYGLLYLCRQITTLFWCLILVHCFFPPTFSLRGGFTLFLSVKVGN